MRIVVADTETADVDPGAGVCEVAWLEITPEMAVISSFEHRVDPEQPISPAASGVHKITDADVVYCPTLAEIFEIASPIRKPDEVTFIAHNAEFDVDKLKDHMNIVAVCDTLTLAKRAYPDSPNHKLTTLVYYLGLPLSGKASHAALVDVWDCFWLLRRLANDLEMNLDELVEESNTARPVTRLEFGKHRGEPFSEIPIRYVQWLSRQPDLDRDVALACKLRLSQ